MNISRFFGATSREAMRQVRMALGPDALIVSNRRVNGGVEILATDQTSAGRVAAREVPATPPSGHPAAPSTTPPQGADVVDAIGAMRGALEARMDEVLWGNHLRRAPQAVSLFQSLLGMGFSNALLRAMLKRLPEDLSPKGALLWARNELLKHLPVLESEDDLWVPGAVVALVGPTGVGKTTTIAKLAARCVKRSGPGKVLLLTTDTYRIGAHEQLKIYGEILRVPVHIVQDAEELRRRVADAAPDQLILIDNVGVSQRDRYVAEQAAMLAQAGRVVSRLLVLNASSQGDTLDEVARTYTNDGGSPLRGCIITKIDEASRLGACVDTAIRYQLPVCYVSNGQKVPENLLFPATQDLIERALAPQSASQALYAPTEADFAALLSMTKAPADASANAAEHIRRQQLLPSLLAAVGNGVPVSVQSLESACTYLDESTACSEAYDLWGGYARSDKTPAALESQVANLWRAAQGQIARASHKHVLALHDQVALQTQTGIKGRLRATLLLGDKAESLISPLQHLAFPQGWLSSDGATSQVPPASGDALLRQVRFIQDQAGLSVVHVFEGGTQSIWRALSAMGASWLAQCAAMTRVEELSCPTTIGALVKTLEHHPVDRISLHLDLSQVCGRSVSEVVVWAAGSSVELVGRQVSPMPVQVVSVRVVSRHDGAVLKEMHALSNMPFGLVPVQTQALWLVAQAESKVALRYAARLWSLLGDTAHPDAELRRAQLAAQLGLAAWQAMQGADAGEVRRVVGALAGSSRLTAPVVAASMLKLLMLKEMTA